ncbi:hypothetical protein GCM10008018_56910 [Paenibacillus marchantiophytorum]|uniref:Stage II sporulation protein M n=1 Tax=Paenibacillus marchantiophytorum TaxID=1619310 RepID=A0ABQ1F8Z6_9BACL|nr:stage II sporulation protein M [Paenibacillus marchantiophytorum]GGA03521.1 hypothetical protein GCM10008018_56910 [Paenibacillus marchantiophytorum]
MQTYFSKNRYLYMGSAFCLTIGGLFGMLMVLAISQEALPMSADVLVSQDRGFEAAWHILFRNAAVALLMISGLFLFAVPTLITLFLNGLWIGAVITSRLLDGVPFQQIVMKLLPHGIFEIPALVLAGAIGLKGLYFYFMPKKEWASHFRFIGYTAGLLIVGAVVEGYITARL